MITRPPPRPSGALGLSFLDCICCGFGAIILLFVLSKGGHPKSLEKAREALLGKLSSIREESDRLERERSALRAGLEAGLQEAEKAEMENRGAEPMLADRKKSLDKRGDDADAEKTNRELETARQELSEVQRRLAQPVDQPKRLAGIPVDSEHVAFIIDTSGSMYKYQWKLVCAKVEETLNAYPNLKGIQVMSEVGVHMFPETAGSWMKDSPATRAKILAVLKVWGGFPVFQRPAMASNPVPGIETAMRDLHRPGLSMCLFIYGDELLESAIGTADAVRRIDAAVGGLTSPPKCPVHCLGFPLVVTGEHLRVSGQSNHAWPRANGENFATFMREVCRMTGGTFVGLSRYE